MNSSLTIPSISSKVNTELFDTSLPSGRGVKFVIAGDEVHTVVSSDDVHIKLSNGETALRDSVIELVLIESDWVFYGMDNGKLIAMPADEDEQPVYDDFEFVSHYNMTPIGLHYFIDSLAARGINITKENLDG